MTTVQRAYTFGTDREGNELNAGDVVTAQNDQMLIYGVCVEFDINRVKVQINEESYIWADEADVTLT